MFNTESVYFGGSLNLCTSQSRDLEFCYEVISIIIDQFTQNLHLFAVLMTIISSLILIYGQLSILFIYWGIFL